MGAGCCSRASSLRANVRCCCAAVCRAEDEGERELGAVRHGVTEGTGVWWDLAVVDEVVEIGASFRFCAAVG